jgi:hypothetical protein
MMMIVEQLVKWRMAGETEVLGEILHLLTLILIFRYVGNTHKKYIISQMETFPRFPHEHINEV